MKTLLASLLLLPAVAFGQSSGLEAYVQSLLKAQQSDLGDPAFAPSVLPNYLQGRPVANTNAALEAYLRQRTIANQVNLFTQPDIQIQASDSFADIEYARSINRQNAMDRATASALYGAQELHNSRAAAQADRNAAQMRRYFGD